MTRRLDDSLTAPSRRWQLFSAWISIAAGLATSATAMAGTRVGLDFVTGGSQPIDFLPQLVQPGNLIEPWALTGNTSRFVTDGAFAGLTETSVQDAILQQVKSHFAEVTVSGGLELDLDFYPTRQTGTNAVNVLIGKHNSDISTWFGIAKPNGAIGSPQGANQAAIAIDELAKLPDYVLAQEGASRPISHYAEGINIVAGTIAHETAHLFGAGHASVALTGSSPYDLMNEPDSGMPNSARFGVRVFTASPGAQPGGLSSQQLLIQNIGVRVRGDVDRSGRVDNGDFSVVFGQFGQTNAVFETGDADNDTQVGNGDFGVVFGAFDTTLDASTESNLARLIYDPDTGNVQLDATDAAGGVITNFVIKNALGGLDFRTGATLPFANFTAKSSPTEISNTDLLATGFGGVWDIGNVFPVGFDASALGDFLTQQTYVGTLGSGNLTFKLVVVPEPAVALLAVGLAPIALSGRTHRRRRVLPPVERIYIF